MNLFRSEGHVKNWLQYDSISAESIMPLSSWSLAFSGPLHRNRLEPNYLSRAQDYAAEMFVLLKKFGKAGQFWTP
jgi:hypothetical protein